MTEESVFPHVRRSDNECVGYLRMSDDGQFVPIDVLWNDVAGPMDLSHAEELLEELGLSCPAEPWWLEVTDHPQRAKVRIREVTTDTVVLTNAEYGDPADIGTPFTEPNPTPRPHKTAPWSARTWLRCIADQLPQPVVNRRRLRPLRRAGLVSRPAG